MAEGSECEWHSERGCGQQGLEWSGAKRIQSRENRNDDNPEMGNGVGAESRDHHLRTNQTMLAS